MKKELCLSLLLVSSLMADNPAQKVIALSIEAPITGLMLVGDEGALTDACAIDAKDGIGTVDLNFPGSLTDFNEELKPLYYGKRYKELDMQSIRQKIYQHYQNYDRPFILISIPPQPKQCGVLQILIQESRLGRLQVVGNKWTKAKRYERYFSIKPGQPISQKKMSADLNFMNRNPYRMVNVIYGPGDKENSTDIILDVQDYRPYRFYVGFDNTGVPSTGRQRLFAGFSWDQLFGFDDLFFYQYSTNYNSNRYHSNIFQYTALLPSKTVLDIYGGFSLLHASLPSPNRKNHGRNIQASARYTVPFCPSTVFSQEFSVGFDLKNTNNTMEFVDYPPTFGQAVNLTQFELGYKCKYQQGRVQWETGVECLFSPMQWLPHQTNSDFSALRPGAESRWAYTRAYYNMRKTFAYPFALNLHLKGQLSTQTLLPSEELGLGGFDSVRGYDTRQYDADSGLVGSIELHSPNIFKTKALHGYGYFLIFMDGGFGWDYTGIPTVHSTDYLLSTGPGFRYFLDRYLTARLDWGIKLHHRANFTGGWGMVQFSLIGSY